MATSESRPGRRAQAPTPKHMLGVWAHPDDEAYLSAGLMARTVEAGGQVTLLSLTDGEGGFPEDDQRPTAERCRQRRRELRSSMATIGVHDVRFLGVADGTLGDDSGDLVVAAIIAVMHEVRPDAVVTFGPDGITGHEDHIANWRLATRAWTASPSGELWYAAKTTTWLEEWRGLHEEFEVWMTEEPTGVRPDELELVIDLEGTDLDCKRAVLAAHASQTAGLAAAFGEDRYRSWIRQEAFRRPTGAELSLFAPDAPSTRASHGRAATAEAVRS